MFKHAFGAYRTKEHRDIIDAMKRKSAEHIAESNRLYQQALESPVHFPTEELKQQLLGQLRASKAEIERLDREEIIRGNITHKRDMSLNDRDRDNAINAVAKQGSEIGKMHATVQLFQDNGPEAVPAPRLI